MNRRKRIEEEIDRTLSSLDGLQRVPGNPWLFTRIKAKMEQEKTVPVLRLPVAVQWAGFCMLLLLNGLVLFAEKKDLSSNEEQLVQAVAKQYGFQQTSDWVSLKPGGSGKQ